MIPTIRGTETAPLKRKVHYDTQSREEDATIRRGMMIISFDDAEMALIMQASRTLPVESRDRFLRLVSEQVRPRVSRFSGP